MTRALTAGAPVGAVLVSAGVGYVVRSATFEPDYTSPARVAMTEITTVSGTDQERFATVIGAYLGAFAARDVPKLLTLTVPDGPDHQRWQNATGASADYAFALSAEYGGKATLVTVTRAYWDAPGMRAKVQAAVDSDKKGRTSTAWTLHNTADGWKVW